MAPGLRPSGKTGFRTEHHYEIIQIKRLILVEIYRAG
jgi:hypothetical protein